MTDWAEGIESRNYGIKREIDMGMLSDLFRVIIALVMVAGALVFYSWMQNQIVNTGYESQNLFVEEQMLLRVQTKLILEEETLRNPGRIDLIARNDLGLAPLRPAQMLFPQRGDAAMSASDSYAMAEPEAADVKRTAQMRTSTIIPGN